MPSCARPPQRPVYAAEIDRIGEGLAWSNPGRTETSTQVPPPPALPGAREAPETGRSAVTSSGRRAATAPVGGTG